VTLVLKIVVLIVVILVVTIAVLRIRKLRRDEIRELSRPVERRLVSPPPSPYAPSKGFRLLDGPIEEQQRPQPARPRLEADHDYVFSETQLSSDETIVPSHFRHDEQWALSKSARRSASMTGLRVAIIAIILVILLGAVGLYLQHHKTPGTTPPTTTTTTKHTTSSPAMRPPSSFALASTLVWSHVSL
jgi:hypothetical protein